MRRNGHYTRRSWFLVVAAVLVFVGAGARATVTGPSTQGQCGPAGARNLRDLALGAHDP